MYWIKTEQSFDSAHFLSGYEGKCSNIHGHRWRIIITVRKTDVEQSGQNKGMIVDFADLKNDLKQEVDFFDHAFIIEKDTLKPLTYEALIKEGFHMITVNFRPTAENFSKYFYDKMKEKGYPVTSALVYETPNNCAEYKEE